MKNSFNIILVTVLFLALGVFGAGTGTAKGKKSKAAKDDSPRGGVELTLVAVGDVGFNRSRLDVHPDGMDLWGKRVPFEKMLEGIRKSIDGDINFANLETVVTDRNDLSDVTKAYNFRSHPNALRLVRDVGFNLLSMANNHMSDYGAEGIRETRKWLEIVAGEKKKSPLYYTGAGESEAEAAEVVVFKVKGVRIAFGATGIGTRAKKGRAGVISPHRADPVLSRLKAADADIRILSMHAGTERKIRPDSSQKSLARRAIDKYDVDIVIGHHPHVVQGIEHYKRGLIFYSLGNFALRGARNMGSDKALRGEGDYGLLVKLGMTWDKKRKKLHFKELEALPVYDMHSGPHPFKDKKAETARIEVLNKLSEELAGDGPLVKFLPKGKVFMYDFSPKESK